jgi:ATP-binding cassette subfamily B protein
MGYIKQKKYLYFAEIIKTSLKPFQKVLALQFLISLIWSIDVSLTPYLIKLMLDDISVINPEEAMTILWKPAAAYIFMSFLMLILGRIHDWLSLKYMHPLRKHICLTAVEKLLNHTYSFYHDHFSGSLADRVDKLSEGIITITAQILNRAFGYLMAITIAIYTIGKIVGIKFAVALILWVAVFLIGSLRFSSTARQLSSKAAEAHSGVLGFIVDIFSNILAIRLFDKKTAELNNLDAISNHSILAAQKRDWCFWKIFAIQGSSFVIFQTICIYWLISGFKNHSVTAGNFALILMINLSLVDCLWAFSHDLRIFAKEFGRVFQGLEIIYNPLEETNNKKPDLIKNEDLSVSKANIKFDNVNFFYKESTFQLKNINLTINSGEKIGLVGYSGGGKSTFINILLRLYDISQGKIMVDGHDINEYSQSALINAMTMIPQEPILFHRTIMENIGYGKNNASEKEIIEAAKRPRAHDFIIKLPLGYNTMVGERGIKLSGGQRQRIVIARAFLKNSRILMMDEATNQLDAITEKEIQESLYNLMQNKTTLVIAHRLSTLIKMDRILVFDQGSIVQDGPHQELIAQEGLYKTLWKTQVEGSLPNNKKQI